MHQTKTHTMLARLLQAGAAAVTLLAAAQSHAAAPGITGPAFNLQAHDGFVNQPDGEQVYTWGYGCNGSPTGFAPAGIAGANCPNMQLPAPTLIVTEGQSVAVTLTNNLPPAAGNTSILFPGFQVTAAAAASQPATCAASTPLVQGVLTSEVANGCAVTYTFTASSPGTRAYYSGTQSDLQIEMGLYGAIIVLPANVPAACTGGLAAQNRIAAAHWGEGDYRLSQAAYDHPKSCYDREYLFQFAEMDGNIHSVAYQQVLAAQAAGCATSASAGTTGCGLQVPTEPYHPSFFVINGRSMPDDMDGNYASQYPNQPYNGNPHMHPGEQVLLRIVGQGRWEHPFHEHANHVRVLARDGNLLLSPSGALSGILMFTTDTFPGQAMDGIFYYTGRGLNWDMYGHNPTSTDPLATLACTPDAYGYNTGFPATDLSYSTAPNQAVASQVNYYEWCQDHNKPLEVAPYGDVNAGGPATLPNANIFTNGAWYSGSPYLGPDATLRATTVLNSVGAGVGTGMQQVSSGCVTGTTDVTNTNGTVVGAAATPYCTNLQPANIQANPSNERAFAFMWHSHNEREITTNNVFPGGMFMMMLVDSREFQIDESN
jgi:FtsP/CotA-like multicopper oxidase with cupredoxin domain